MLSDRCGHMQSIKGGNALRCNNDVGRWRPTWKHRAMMSATMVLSSVLAPNAIPVARIDLACQQACPTVVVHAVCEGEVAILNQT
jgi:hypothetical protein